ncbi:MAG: C39 family peptidase [Clostridia bacterium]|nr:C39 family peptidase [Clostridia bacterium]
MSKVKFIIPILILVVLLLSAFVFLHFRGATVISADGREDISFPITQFCQDDARWSSDKLGASRYTMKTSGCITTSIATALSRGLDEITPGELNKAFSENGVYDTDGNIQWAKLDALGYKADVLSEVSEDEIYANLKNGQFPIVRVRVNGTGNFHYVLIVGVENGEYICMDPLKDELTPLSAYLNKVYAVRVVY